MSTSRLASLFSLVALTACGGGTDVSFGPSVPAYPPAPVSVPAAPATTCSDAGKAVAAASTATNTVCMLTTHGEIVLELYADKAPITVGNFLQYVAAKRYDNTLFHRVVKSPNVVQGGGLTPNWTDIATFAPIALESDKGLSNVRGTIAMARLGGTNTATATSQFFFNVGDNSACLDRTPKTPNCDQNGYAVFGKVIAGLDTVDKIAALKVDYYAAPIVPTATFWVEKLK